MSKNDVCKIYLFAVEQVNECTVVIIFSCEMWAEADRDFLVVSMQHDT